MMTMKDNTHTVYDVYHNGIRTPENSSDPVYNVTEDGWAGIEWNKPDHPDEVEQAQAEIATELHYLYLSQLSLLGDIIGNEPDLDMKRLATVLDSARMRNVDAWGRYHKMMGRETQITSDMKDHSTDIGTDDVLCQLTAVALTGTFTAALHRHLDEDDTTFNQLLHRDAQQGAKNRELSARYLQRWLASLDESEQHQVLGRIENCVSWLEQYVDRYRDVMSSAHIDGDKVVDDFRTNSYKFYERIQPQTDPAAVKKETAQTEIMD